MRRHAVGLLVVGLLLCLAAVAGAQPVVAPRAEDAADTPVTSYEYDVSLAGLEAIAPVNGFTGGIFASAAAIAEGRRGSATTLSVGGRIATPGLGERCRYLQGGAAVYVTRTREAAEQVSGETWGGTCLFRAEKPDTGGPGLEVEHRLQFDLRPGLGARRALLRRRYTGGSLRIAGSAFEGRDTALPYAAALFPYRFDFDFTDQEEQRQIRLLFTIDGVSITPPTNIIFGDARDPDAILHVPADDLAVLGLFGGASNVGTTDVMVGGMMFLRLTRLRIPGGVALDVEIGLGGGDVTPHDEAGEPLPGAEVFTPTGYLGAAGLHRGLKWSARYGREVYPTFDGAIALEDRLSGTLELARALPGVELAGFVARTAVFGQDGAGADWTGGATLSRTWALGGALSLSAIAEAARSYYATLDGDAAPAPEPVARALVVLTGRLGSP